MLVIIDNVVNTTFDGGKNEGFKKFSYVRENGYRSVVSNVRGVTKFEDTGYGASFPDSGKNSFIKGTLKEKTKRMG